jgi:hypothetical protein
LYGRHCGGRNGVRAKRITAPASGRVALLHLHETGTWLRSQR